MLTTILCSIHENTMSSLQTDLVNNIKQMLLLKTCLPKSTAKADSIRYLTKLLTIVRTTLQCQSLKE
jgi:hypothetical protein